MCIAKSSFWGHSPLLLFYTGIDINCSCSPAQQEESTSSVDLQGWGKPGLRGPVRTGTRNSGHLGTIESDGHAVFIFWERKHVSARGVWAGQQKFESACEFRILLEEIIEIYMFKIACVQKEKFGTQKEELYPTKSNKLDM